MDTETDANNSAENSADVDHAVELGNPARTSDLDILCVLTPPWRRGL